MKQLIYIALIFFCISCRKDVTPKLPAYKEKVVIEASIEIGGLTTVYLSHSVPYFGDFDYSAPQAAFIKGGLVVVSDGIVRDTLKEIDPSLGYLYIGTKITGQEGKTYSLSVTVGGKTFETSTTILHPPKLDSVYYKPAGGGLDSLGFIMQTFSEPAGSGDCYRWLAKRLHRDQFYAAPFGSAFNDQFVDGKKFEFGYDRGPQPNQLTQNKNDPERGYYKRGDTVVVKFCKIGRAEYDFWNTYYLNKSSNGNPFSAPTNIKSMFADHDNAFGAFTGYGQSYDTLIIPKH